MKRQGSSVWGDSSFGFPFRTYQRLILERIGNRLDEPGERETFHIVSPPGSGKTVLGIELARRLGERAVVFSPTTTIQRQWVDKAGMFKGPEDPPLASTDPTAPTPLIALTYQIVTTVGGDTDSLALAARAHWERELIAKEPDDAAAVVERLDLMLKNNNEAYNKEIRRRIAAVRREALRAPSVDLGELLHPNARAIIDGLVNAGVRTVVLDECHHLLDYWAIVIAYLIARIDRPRIIGLTATLPSPEDANTFENYEALLGDVTYEVPTPAVVKSGDLAPYRDLVAFTEPTADEATYLDGAMAQFHGAVTEILNDPSFSAWLAYGAAGRGESPRARWDWLLAQNTPRAVAMLRHASLAGLDLDGEWIAPPGNADVAVPMTRFPVPHQARQPATVNDTIAVLESFALGHLKVSADPLDRSRLAAIRDALKPFGYTLTESGLRQRRPIAESVLSYSAAKTSMAARILAQEETALAGRLRAVVVTDFEQTGSLLPADGTAYPRGSARRVFADFTRDPACHHLDPVLVTGKTLWIDADHGANLVAWFNTWLNDHGVDAHCEAGDHPLDTVIEVVGTGPGWRSGVYVRMVTPAFEAGLIRVLVGTRGLFAEGWDALTLNVLVDLTTAATATATQQLRGRTLRKDPNWPKKVAHNWDVVCLPPNADAPPGGYTDLHRLERRHNSLWGILPEHGAMPEHVGRIVKSTDHVDTAIRPAARVLETPMGTTIHSPLLGASSHAGARSRLHEATERAWQEIQRRDWSYAAWRIGEDYDNEASAVASMTRPSLPFRTVFTVTGTLRAMLVEFRYALLGLLATVIEIFAYTLNTLRLRGARGLLFVMGVTAVATVVMSGVAAVKAWRVYRTLMRGDHPDTVLKDVGRAVLLALRDLRLVSVECQPEDVLVIETPALDYEVRLSRASAADADLFARSMAEALAPIDRQRYLISRNVAALPDIWLRPLWAALRRFAGGDSGITYHAVPEVLGSRKERAEVFQRHWNANVGRGRLIYTKNPEGFELLSAVRTRQQPESESSVYDVWR